MTNRKIAGSSDSAEGVLRSGTITVRAANGCPCMGERGAHAAGGCVRADAR
jgi:hypothetical protein